MRIERRRTKKLIVAFHFLRPGQAGWKCDTCRKAGLEKKRRCGFLGTHDAKGAAPVWVRNGVALETCPRSYITAESIALLEEFELNERFGWLSGEEPSAHQAEAFAILKAASVSEIRDGQHNSTGV